MAYRPVISPAHAASWFPAVLARIMLAYVLVLQGVTGATASGQFMAIGPDQPLLLCSGATLPPSGEDQPPHDMACCFTGCLFGGAILAPPDRPALATPGWHGAHAHFTASATPGQPRPPTASFQPRGPPIAS